MKPLLLLSLVFVAGLNASFGYAADPMLVGNWRYINGISEGRTANVGGNLTLKADGTFSDTRRIRGPRADFGADVDGTWTSSGDKLNLNDTSGKPVLDYRFFIGQEVRDGVALTLLTLKGEGLTYLLGREAR